MQAMLSARGLEPIHRFGQNFLVQDGMLGRIADAAELTRGEVVLEPGPGPGGLTEELLDRGARVVAVELDRGLVGHLEDVFSAEPNLRLISGDILKKKSAIAPEVLEALDEELGKQEPLAPWTVVSNLPYQISSPFLSALVQLPRPPRRIVVMLQAEVGKVLLAAPGDDDYSALSFLARVHLDVRRLFAVPPQAFFPAPQVSSAVMRLDPRAERIGFAPELLPVVRRLFQTRRKKLGKTLTQALESLHDKEVAARGTEALLNLGVEAGTRIDGVDPDALATAIATALDTPAARAWMKGGP